MNITGLSRVFKSTIFSSVACGFISQDTEHLYYTRVVSGASHQIATACTLQIKAVLCCFLNLVYFFIEQVLFCYFIDR